MVCLHVRVCVCGVCLWYVFTCVRCVCARALPRRAAPHPRSAPSWSRGLHQSGRHPSAASSPGHSPRAPGTQRRDRPDPTLPVARPEAEVPAGRSLPGGGGGTHGEAAVVGRSPGGGRGRRPLSLPRAPAGAGAAGRRCGWQWGPGGGLSSAKGRTTRRARREEAGAELLARVAGGETRGRPGCPALCACL